MKSIRVDIVSDTVCPWCYIGKRRLEAAIAKFRGQAQFDVRWHPFMLNPNAPVEGQDKAAMYEAKFGKERVASMIPMMQENFRKEGLKPMSFKGLTGNTLNSHRLIWKAGTISAQAQDAVVEDLMQAYFCDEKFINDPTVLRSAAAKAGLQLDVDEFLRSGEGTDEVRQELVKYARGYHVSGVPFFVIDGKHTLSGAQPPEQFAAVFDQALEQ